MTDICHCEHPKPMKNDVSISTFCGRCGHWIIETEKTPTQDQVVHYRCTNETCARSDKFVEPIEAHLHLLPDEGCGLCGCKRLEILDHPTKGHFIINWRSQKSERKRKKKELRTRDRTLTSLKKMRRTNRRELELAGGPYR